MYCGKCGKEINNTATFCKYCGAKTQISNINTRSTVNNSAYSEDSEEDFVTRIQNSFKQIGKDIKEMNYKVPQVVMSIMVLVSAIVFMCTFLFHANWILFLACLFTGYLFLRKEEYNTKPMAISLTIILGKESITNIVILSSNMSVGDADAIRILIEFLLIIAILIFYWLIASGIYENDKHEKAIHYTIAISFFVYSFIRLCFAIVAGQYMVNAVSNLGFAILMASYLIMFLYSEKTILKAITKK